jgi:hypothetical protein
MSVLPYERSFKQIEDKSDNVDSCVSALGALREEPGTGLFALYVPAGAAKAEGPMKGVFAIS